MALLATKSYAVDVALCWNGDTQMATIKQQAVNIDKTEEMKSKTKARIGCTYCSDEATYVGLIRNEGNSISKIPLCGNHLNLYGASRPIKHGDFLENDKQQRSQNACRSLL